MRPRAERPRSPRVERNSPGEGRARAPRTVLSARNLEVRRGGAVILQVPSLSVGEGEILALIGPNGAGKSTLLQALSFLCTPFLGEIFHRGRKVAGELPAFDYRRKLAMVFQEPLLFDTTVFQNVASGLRIRKTKRADVEALVREQLERFGIGHLGGRSAKTLSGGEAQRTSLARAFAVKPEILFLDEPFSSLDPPSRESLVEDLERALRRTGTTALFATHDRLDALRLSDRMAVMHKGRIVQIGSPEEVMNRPVDEFVASFVGVDTILPGVVTRRGRGTFAASVEGREIEAVGDIPLGASVMLCIRPENVVLSTGSSRERTSARNVFPASVRKVVSSGPYRKVLLDCGFPLAAYVTAHSLKNLSIRKGGRIRASFKATAVHVIERGK